MMVYTEGTKVQWEWGNGAGNGKIDTVYTKKVTLRIKDTDVTREASQEKPAYYIRQNDGNAVLKSHSEVTKV